MSRGGEGLFLYSTNNTTLRLVPFTVLNPPVESIKKSQKITIFRCGYMFPSYFVARS